MGFCGWDGPKEHKLRKWRKAFQKRRELFPKQSSKYPLDLGRQHELSSISWQRIEKIKSHQQLKIATTLILLVVSSLWLTSIFLTIPLKYFYSTEVLSSELRDQLFRHYTYKGYVALAYNDDEGAIRAFKQVFTVYEESPPTALALASIYYRHCLEDGQDCTEAEIYLQQQYIQTLHFSDTEAQEAFYQAIIDYNQKKLTYLGLSHSLEIAAEF